MHAWDVQFPQAPVRPNASVATNDMSTYSQLSIRIKASDNYKSRQLIIKKNYIAVPIEYVGLLYRPKMHAWTALCAQAPVRSNTSKDGATV